MQVNLAGIISLSMVDYPSNPCLSIFVRGCDRRCKHCHNKEYLNGETYVDIDLIFHAIDEATPFISAVICSGGEPLLQMDVMKEIASYVHNRGLKFGVHTSHPELLCELKGLVDYALVSDPDVDPNHKHAHRAVFYDFGGQEYTTKDKIVPIEKIGKFADH
jgi:pyruvate-formate lyase-activating enzyme